MKFGDIFPLLLVLLILYYAAMIAMDLYKAKQEKEAQKDKDTEEDIDISDEAATFQPIRIRRDEPKKQASTASDEAKSDEKTNEADSKSPEPPEAKPSEPARPAKAGNDESQEAETKAAVAPEPMGDPFDPESYKIPDEVLAEHRKEHEESEVNRDSNPGNQKDDEPKQVTPKKRLLREPVMTNGIPAENLVAMAEAQANGGNTDLMNFAYKCESA